jgi:surface protein
MATYRQNNLFYGAYDDDEDDDSPIVPVAPPIRSLQPPIVPVQPSVASPIIPSLPMYIINDSNIKRLVINYYKKNVLALPINLQNIPIENWDVSAVKNMSDLFANFMDFNEPLNDWNVSEVTNMDNMFFNCTKFNQPLDKWNVSKVTNMDSMFQSCEKFDKPLNDWNVSNVTNMKSMFANCKNFNQPLNKWNVSKVTNMKYMFNSCENFNQPLNSWNVSNVTNMERMFFNCTNFNQPLNKWNVSKVTNINHMFTSCKKFNQPLNNWTINPAVFQNKETSLTDWWNGTTSYEKVEMFNNCGITENNKPPIFRSQSVPVKSVNLPVSGILSSTQNMSLTRSSSIGAQDQGSEGTCYAYVTARLITRLITQKFPDQFEMNDDKANLLYSQREEENCFLYNSIDLNKVIKTLTIDKCSIDERYNHMLLFYFTLFAIKKKFGCEGNLSSVVLDSFFDLLNFFNINLTFETPPKPDILTPYILSPKDPYILSLELDTLAIQKFIHPLLSEALPSKISIEIDKYNTYDNSSQRNWILNFPEGAKKALENKMYICFGFCLSENQWATINTKNIYDSNPIIKDTSCILPISCHAMVITKWEQEAPGMPAYITILNSWGPSWGNNGFIRISSENYDKFVLNPSCKEHKNLVNMEFTYFKVKDDKPFVSSKMKPEISKGGKTKKYKKIRKNKSKKRKSKKRKSKKIRKNKSKKRA